MDDILYSGTVGLKIDKSLVSRYAVPPRMRPRAIDNKLGKRSLIDGTFHRRKSETVILQKG